MGWPTPHHRPQGVVRLHPALRKRGKEPGAIRSERALHRLESHFICTGLIGADRAIERVKRALFERLGTERCQKEERAIVDDVEGTAAPGTLQRTFERRA